MNPGPCVEASVDAVVVGAGVVGLAVARRLALAGLDTVIVESERQIGQGVSSRSSEVIHAGLYHPIGSLKSKLCVAGRQQLYDYAVARSIPHRRTEKLVVATSLEQLDALEALHRHAVANGVDGLSLIDASEAGRLEPALRCVAAMRSRSTGIIDSHALMMELLADAEQGGAALALGSRVVSAACADGRQPHRLWVESVDGPTQLSARIVVNAAALGAVALAQRTEGLPQDAVPHARLCKGNYFSLMGACPFQRLIYPMPEAAGLGVHLTLDLTGQARFGPDVQWLPEGQAIDSQTLSVDASRAEAFELAVRRFWPNVPAGGLQAAYSGIRPKIHGPEEPAADFQVHGPEAHGVSGWVNLFGIESPGLTSCLALADEVMARLVD